MKVLIVEDSPEVAERLVEIVAETSEFEKTGTAGDVAEACHLVAVTKPDVILLDLQIPGGSGLDVLQKVKAEQPAAVVIVLTNHATPPMREICLRAGADYFLDKSIEFDSLPVLLVSVANKCRLAAARGA